jgi:hypothetical protein
MGTARLSRRDKDHRGLGSSKTLISFPFELQDRRGLRSIDDQMAELPRVVGPGWQAQPDALWSVYESACVDDSLSGDIARHHK